jgi:hypothetical protein
MKSEVSTDLSKIGVPVRADFEQFAADTGRKLHLEIEPGTFLVANVGSLVSTVQDIVSTGTDGHTFIKVLHIVAKQWCICIHTRTVFSTFSIVWRLLKFLLWIL